MAFHSVSLPCVVVFSLMTLIQCRSIDLYGCRLPGSPTGKEMINFQRCVAATNGIQAAEGGRWGRSLRHREFIRILRDCPYDAEPTDFVKCVAEAQRHYDLAEELEQQEPDQTSSDSILKALEQLLEEDRRHDQLQEPVVRLSSKGEELVANDNNGKQQQTPHKSILAMFRSGRKARRVALETESVFTKNEKTASGNTEDALAEPVR